MPTTYSGGGRRRGERQGFWSKSTMFKPCRGRAIAGLSFLTPKNEGPTWGGCVSKFRKCTMPPGSVRLFFICSLFHSTGLAYVWYGYVAFSRRIGVGYHLSTFGNRKVLALEDRWETICLPLIFGFVFAAQWARCPDPRTGCSSHGEESD